jgi:hypothetical protein
MFSLKSTSGNPSLCVPEPVLFLEKISLSTSITEHFQALLVSLTVALDHVESTYEKPVLMLNI